MKPEIVENYMDGVSAVVVDGQAVVSLTGSAKELLAIMQGQTNHQRTASWLQACGKTPCPSHLSIQIGCDMEEQAEFLQCLEFDSELDATHMLAIIEGLQIVASALKRGLIQAKIRDHLREEALDAICDREVTGNGISYLAGFDKDAADQAVLASNEAKLVDGKPVLLPGGKIGKPEGWKAPSLGAFV